MKKIKKHLAQTWWLFTTLFTLLLNSGNSIYEAALPLLKNKVPFNISEYFTAIKFELWHFLFLAFCITILILYPLLRRIYHSIRSKVKDLNDWFDNNLSA